MFTLNSDDSSIFTFCRLSLIKLKPFENSLISLPYWEIIELILLTVFSNFSGLLLKIITLQSKLAFCLGSKRKILVIPSDESSLFSSCINSYISKIPRRKKNGFTYMTTF